ncbi:MAG: HAD family phosphatase [Candidatus Omnitrophica bacterium]|nr:HAD family phosphatase [Candidatus Omnitrophota bacterium]
MVKYQFKRCIAMGIEAVIFDLDGVIFDSEILHKIAWEKVFATHGIFVDQQDYAKGIGISDRDFLKDLAEQKRVPEDIDNLISEKKRFLLEISDQAKPIDGIGSFIKELHRNFKLAVASNTDRDFVLKLIENAQMKSFFSVIMGCQDISKSKPDPEIYLKCALVLGIAPIQCAVIEDSPAGIKAAKSAGMKCIALATNLEKSKLREADLIMEKPDAVAVKKFLGFFK